jgi:mono/diheme cytochrome c family protein
MTPINGSASDRRHEGAADRAEDGMKRRMAIRLAHGCVTAGAVAVAGLCGSLPSASAQDSGFARGQQIAERLCARCHAIGKSDASPDPKAPPFRSIGKLYPLDHLGEAFAEGIVTGDNKMPEFKL